jgi:hypothetical protein
VNSRLPVRRLTCESLESRRLLTIDIPQVSALELDEGSLAELSSLTFHDSTPDAAYTVTIDWGDGSPREIQTVSGVPPASSIRIRVDYQYDTLGFFDQPGSRGALQRAADTLGAWLGDELAAIAPAGQNMFTAIIDHPGTGQIQQIPGLAVGQNEVIVFAGGRALGGVDLALGVAGTFQAAGTADFLETVNQRAQPGAPVTDLGLWGGSLTFDTDKATRWHFGATTDGLGTNEFDLFTVALHELFHLIGFSDTQVAYARHVSGGRFGGPAAVLQYDANAIPPLAPGDLSHWADSTRDNGQPVLMAATLDAGVRKTATPLDLAVLQDIGWQPIISSLTGSFSATHEYQDDGLFEIEITVADGAENATASISVQVHNVGPQVIVAPLPETRVGNAVSLAASYVDRGSQDSLLGVIDWGDGTQSRLGLAKSPGSIEATHSYSAAGHFEIQVAVADDDGGIGLARTTVSVWSSRWQNVTAAWDVNSDGVLSPLDALLVINEINQHRFSTAHGRLPAERSPQSDWYFDVDGDNVVSALDALLVINRLNDRPSNEANVARRGKFGS